MGFSWNYGYPTGIFYGDAFLYPFALLAHFEWLNLPQTFRLFVFCHNAAVVFVAFYSFHHIFGSKKVAFFGCTLYCASIWHLTNLYVRCAVGEYTAMIFLPLLAAGMCDLHRQRAKSGALLLIVGFTGLLHSHVITTILTVDCLALYILFEGRIFLRRNRLESLLIAAGVLLAINAGFILPFLYYYTSVPIFGLSRTPEHLRNISVHLRQLFNISYNVNKLLAPLATPDAQEMPQGIGIAPMLVFMASCLFALSGATAKVMRHRGGSCLKISGFHAPLSLRPFATIFMLSALFLWLSTEYFPYAFMAKYAPWLYVVLCETCQFPMRYHTISTLLLSLLAMQMCLQTGSSTSQSIRATAIVFTAVIMFTSLAQSLHFIARTYDETRVSTDEQIVLRLPNFGDNFYRMRHVYAPHQNSDLLIHSSSDKEVSFSDVVRSNFRFELHARNTGKNPGWLDFPVWNYPGYKAVSSKGYKLGVADGDNRRVRVYLPPGFNDTLTLRWVTPLSWRVAHIVSWVSLVALLLFAFTPLPKWLARIFPRLCGFPTRLSAPW